MGIRVVLLKGNTLICLTAPEAMWAYEPRLLLAMIVSVVLWHLGPVLMYQVCVISSLP